MDRGVQKIPSNQRTGTLIAICAAAGVSVFLIAAFLQPGRNLDAAAQFFGRFDSHDKLSDNEASALQALFSANHETRAGFLHLALADNASAKRFGLYRHAFAVALSQADKREARTLFESEIVPTLKESRDVLTLGECFYLMLRWTIIGSIQEHERDRLATVLVKRIIDEKNAAVRNELASGIRIFENKVSAHAAENLAASLADAARRQLNPETIGALSAALGVFTPKIGPVLASSLSYELLFSAREIPRPGRAEALLGAFTHVATRLDAGAASETASRLTTWFSTETNFPVTQALALALEPIQNRMGSGPADRLAEIVAHQIEFEHDPNTLESYFVAFRTVAPHLSLEQAQRITPLLLDLLTGIDASEAAMSGAAIAALGNRQAASTIEKARATLLLRMREEHDTRLFSALAFSLGTLSEGLPKYGFQEAALVVVDRVAEERGAYEITLLNGALSELVKPGIDPAVASQLAGQLVERIQREREIPNLLRVVAALQLIAKYVPEDDAPPFVAKLVERMGPESGQSILRSIGFAIGSFGEGAEKTQIEAAAAKLTARIVVEPDPAAMRELVAGLVNLGEDEPESYTERVAARLNYLISVADAGDLPDLVASLAALEDNVSEDEMASAANAVVKAALDATEPGDIDAAASALEKIVDDLDKTQISKLVGLLVQRIDGERDEAMLRSLGEFLSRFPPDSLSTAQLKNNQKLFVIPHAPCSLAALVDPPHRTEFAARTVQNPLCSESSWEQLAFLLVPSAEERKDVDDNDEQDADFRTLIVADDDGESDTAVQGLGSYGVDFNRLSDAVDPFR